MGARDWLNQHPSIVAAVAGLALCAALGVLLWQAMAPRPGGEPDAFYLDLETNRFFVADGDAVPPIPMPGGGGGARGVRAQVFGCGECPTTIQRMTLDELEAAGGFVGWLERYRDEDRDILERYRQRDPDEPFDVDEEMRALEVQERGPLVRTLEQTRWVTRDSDVALQIMNALDDRCAGGQRAVACEP